MNFTNSLNNRGCKSQGPANMNSFPPSHLLLLKKKKTFLRSVSISGFPFFSLPHLNLHFPSSHLLPLCAATGLLPHISLDPPHQIFSVLLTTEQFSMTPYFPFILLASSYALHPHLPLLCMVLFLYFVP